MRVRVGVCSGSRMMDQLLINYHREEPPMLGASAVFRCIAVLLYVLFILVYIRYLYSFFICLFRELVASVYVTSDLTFAVGISNCTCRPT